MGQKYAAYDASGAILAYYDSVDSPVPAGMTDVIEITDEQWLTCISTPGWTVANGELVEPTAPTAADLLAAEQDAQWIAIKAERDRRTQTGGYYVASVSKWFNSDPFSRTQQLGLLMYAANMPAGIKWKTMDGSFVTMTPASCPPPWPPWSLWPPSPPSAGCPSCWTSCHCCACSSHQ